MTSPDWAKATALILGFEKFRPYVYDDRHPDRRYVAGTSVEGTLTVGFGETDPAFVARYMDHDITREEAMARFAERVPAFWEGVSVYITVDLNPNQAAAVTSLAYNSGAGGMYRDAPSLLWAINGGRFVEAAQLWRTAIINADTPDEAGLRRRRAAEAALFAEPYAAADPWGGLFVALVA